MSRGKRREGPVVGAGAIGAYVVAALDRAGAEVHLLGRRAHLRAMQAGGVHVKSPRGDFTAHPHATDSPAEIGRVDYVSLGLKAHAYPSCGPLIEPLLAEHTASSPGRTASRGGTSTSPRALRRP